MRKKSKQKFTRGKQTDVVAHGKTLIESKKTKKAERCNSKEKVEETHKQLIIIIKSVVNQQTGI